MTTNHSAVCWIHGVENRVHGPPCSFVGALHASQVRLGPDVVASEKHVPQRGSRRRTQSASARSIDEQGLDVESKAVAENKGRIALASGYSLTLQELVGAEPDSPRLLVATLFLPIEEVRKVVIEVIARRSGRGAAGPGASSVVGRPARDTRRPRSGRLGAGGCSGAHHGGGHGGRRARRVGRGDAARRRRHLRRRGGPDPRPARRDGRAGRRRTRRGPGSAGRRAAGRPCTAGGAPVAGAHRAAAPQPVAGASPVRPRGGLAARPRDRRMDGRRLRLRPRPGRRRGARPRASTQRRRPVGPGTRPMPCSPSVPPTPSGCSASSAGYRTSGPCCTHGGAGRPPTFASSSRRCEPPRSAPTPTGGSSRLWPATAGSATRFWCLTTGRRWTRRCCSGEPSPSAPRDLRPGSRWPLAAGLASAGARAPASRAHRRGSYS